MKRSIITVLLASILLISIALSACTPIPDVGDTVTTEEQGGKTTPEANETTVEPDETTAEPSVTTKNEEPTGTTADAPAETTNAPDNEAADYTYSSNGDGTCTLTGLSINSADKTVIKIPATSPSGDRVTAIADEAFMGNKRITEVTVPEGVLSVGQAAFSGCSLLEEITLPDSLTEIKMSAFYGTAYYGSAPRQNGVLYIGKHLIEADRNMSGSVAIREGTLTVADYAFYSCHDLTAITFPEGLRSIGVYAFFWCKKIESIDIPESVSIIKEQAFYGCAALTDISIPDSTEIEAWVFSSSGYYNDENNWEDGVLYLGTRLLEVNTDANQITVKEGTTVIEESAFYGRTKLSSVIIPKSVTKIDSEAFVNCDMLAAIRFGGTKAEWEQVTLGTNWNKGTGNYTVRCSDENIAK